MSTATELLRRALEEIESQDADLRSEFEGFNKIWQGPPIIEEIRAFLAAEPEAEPVAWIQPNHLEKAQFMPFLCRVEPKQRDDFIPLYTRPEPEAETIETLMNENFTLAAGQCTEGGPWGDEGGSPYCKYTRPEPARKPMTEDEIIRAFSYDGNGSLNDFGLGAIEGVRFAERYHGIGRGME